MLELKYFVLKPKGSDNHAYASRSALLRYAEVIQKDDPKLAQDLIDWVERCLDECLDG